MQFTVAKCPLSQGFGSDLADHWEEQRVDV